MMADHELARKAVAAKQLTKAAGSASKASDKAKDISSHWAAEKAHSDASFLAYKAGNVHAHQYHSAQAEIHRKAARDAQFKIINSGPSAEADHYSAVASKAKSSDKFMAHVSAEKAHKTAAVLAKDASTANYHLGKASEHAKAVASNQTGFAKTPQGVLMKGPRGGSYRLVNGKKVYGK